MVRGNRSGISKSVQVQNQFRVQAREPSAPVAADVGLLVHQLLQQPLGQPDELVPHFTISTRTTTTAPTRVHVSHASPWKPNPPPGAVISQIIY